VKDLLAIDGHWTAELLTRFLRVELERTGLRDFVVGLSGGIDSAVSTALAARAVGPDRVHAYLLPYRQSSAASIDDALEVAENLALKTERVDISPMIDGFEEASGDVGRHRLGNVMARARMTILFDRSLKRNALVLGTSNKTELLLGYGTLHGDLASALNPIGDLYKTQVLALAEFLELPESVRKKPPSADLWPDQTDEDDLGFSYERIDRLLIAMIDQRHDDEVLIAAGFERSMIDDVRQRIVRTQFKRMPPVIGKVSLRTIGWDFRYPRAWKS